jgi:hypothetical protein
MTNDADKKLAILRPHSNSGGMKVMMIPLE